MPENVVNTKLRLSTEGTESAVKDYAALEAEAEKTAASIAQANDAAKDLNATLAQAPTIPTADAGAGTALIKATVKDTNKELEKTSSVLSETGKAGEQLGSVLNQVLPGLGGVAQSLLSMNPIAIAGTVALTGITAVFGQLQKQAQETQKAIEAESAARVKAETDRIATEVALDARVNMARSGSNEARESIIKELGAVTASGVSLNAQITNANDKLRQAKEDLVQSSADAVRQFHETGTVSQDLVTRGKTLQSDIENYTKTITDLTPQLQANETQFGLLNAAAKDLNITAQEQSAVMKSVTEGADGANTALSKLWDTTKQGPSILDNAAKGVSDAINDIGQGINKAAQEIAARQAKERADAEKQLIDVNEKLTSVEQDRGAALADRLVEDQRAAEFAALNDRLANAQAYDAAQQKTRKIAEIEQQGHAADLAAQGKYMEDQQKLLSSYLKAEQTATEDYSRERVRKLEDLYNTLNNLASQRDVAGFVNARRAGMTDIGRGDEDAGTAARRRREQYTQQQADLEAAARKETATRQAQLNQRVQQEQQAGQQEITAASRAQKAIADLHAQYAAQDLRARRQSEDAAYQQTIAILQKKRTDELKITAGAAAGVIDLLSKARDAITRFGSGLGEAVSRNVPHFDTGTPFIQRSGLAVVHKGERVMTAAENARFMRGGNSGNSVTPVFQISVGEHVSQSDITMLKSQIVGVFKTFGGNSNI